MNKTGSLGASAALLLCAGCASDGSLMIPQNNGFNGGY